MVNILCTFLVGLCYVHVKNESIFYERDKIYFCVNDILRPRDEIPLEHQEGVRRDVFGFLTFKEDLRELLECRHRHVSFALGCGYAEILFLFCRSASAALLVMLEVIPEFFRNLCFVETTFHVEMGQRRGGAVVS